MSVRSAFDTARAENRAALVGYLPAGFPDVPGAIDALRAMVDAGCDVIDIGMVPTPVLYYATHVAPAPLSPKRRLARVLLAARCRWRLRGART